MGVFSLAMAATLLAVLAAAGITAALLIRVTDAATDIDEKAEKIAVSGRGINIATDSAIQLRRTNELATSILGNVEPLDEQLATIVSLARDVDDVAASIDRRVEVIEGTASAINQVASDITATADAIATELRAILEVAELIDRDAMLINTNLDRTIELARAIHSDTTNIFGLARAAHQTTACIDQKLGGPAAADPHCESLE